MSDARAENLARGMLMREQGRLEDAEAFFRQAIAQDPDHAESHAQLAFCLTQMDGRRKEALASIDAAIALEPEESSFHSIRALTLAILDQGKEGILSAEKARELDPYSPFALSAMAHCYMSMMKWSDAERCARGALAINPDDDHAGNILASVLRLQGKQHENRQAVAKLLSDNPEDAFAHTNAGWTSLQHGDHRQAETHFREALRLDPEFEGAREGMLESFKSRSPFYRLYLRYLFFMQRFQRGNQWMIIIGLYLAFRFGRALLAQLHPIAAVVLTVVYLSFVLWVWVASGVGNLLILCDRQARFALKRGEAAEGLFVGGGLALGILCAIAGALVSSPLLFLGAALFLGAIPASLTFTNESTTGRVVFGSILTFVYLAGGMMTVAVYVQDTEFTEVAGALFGFSILASFLCTWIGNIPALRIGRET